MRVDYLRPARRGDLTALAKTVRVGKMVSVADVEIRDAAGTLVAVGRACYASPRPPSAGTSPTAREETP